MCQEPNTPNPARSSSSRRDIPLRVYTSMPPTLVVRRDLQLRQLQRAASYKAKPKPKPKPQVKKQLVELPTDCLARITAMLARVEDIGRLDCVCHAFHASSDGEPSVVEQGLRLRADSALLARLPDHERSWTQKLCWDERRRKSARFAPVAAGAMHSVFIDAAGSLLTCGVYHASVGFLGHGQTVSRLATPTAVRSLDGVAVQSVAASHHHTLVLGEDPGTVFACGRGDHGRLGNGCQEHECIPTVLEALRHVRVCGVAAGRDHSLFCDEHGSAWSCGSASSGQLGQGETCSSSACTPRVIESLKGRRVVAVVAGADTSFFLTEDGCVSSCGEGPGLGRDLVEGPNPVPHPVRGVLATVRVTAIAAGRMHSLFCDAAGSAFSCGLGTLGRLGHGDTRKQMMPRRIEALAAANVCDAAAGEAHSLFLTASGAVLSCGWNVSGQLGHGLAALEVDSDEPELLLPRAIERLADIRGVAAGYTHSLAFDSCGRVFGWGNGADECLGLEVREYQAANGGTRDILSPLEYPGVRVRSAGGASERRDRATVAVS